MAESGARARARFAREARGAAAGGGPGQLGESGRSAGPGPGGGAPPRVKVLIQERVTDLRVLLWSKCLMWESFD